MEEEKLRLKKLIEHWAEHNDEHSTRFEESTKKASEMGLPGVAEELKGAAEAGMKVSEHLRSAIEKMVYPGNDRVGG
jgi:hypothetical protein